MKECTQIEKHGTCQHRARNGDKSRLLCTSYGCLCGYRSDFIRFEDIADDTDEVVLAGIKRLNEIMGKYPTYYEDQKVVFQDE